MFVGKFIKFSDNYRFSAAHAVSEEVNIYQICLCRWVHKLFSASADRHRCDLTFSCGCGHMLVRLSVMQRAYSVNV